MTSQRGRERERERREAFSIRINFCIICFASNERMKREEEREEKVPKRRKKGKGYEGVKV